MCGAHASQETPVTIVDGCIRVDENMMEDGEQYTFEYQGKGHMMVRDADGKLKLYELRQPSWVARAIGCAARFMTKGRRPSSA